MTKNIYQITPNESNWGWMWRKKEESDDKRRISGAESLRFFKERPKGLLSKVDREKIAGALFLEIENLEKHPDVSKKPFSRAELMRQSGLAQQGDANPTKRLHELTLPPWGPIDASKKRRPLCATYYSYIELIKAIIDFSNEEVDEICDRIFSGTSYSGTETDINKNRHLAHELERKIDHIDKMMANFSSKKTLTQIFDETAQFKEILQKSGSVTNWPYFDLSGPYESSDDELPNWEYPYWARNYDNDVSLSYQDKRRYTMFATCLDWYDAVLHLPRVYLGCAVCLPDWCDAAANTAKRNLWFDEISRSRKEIAELRYLAARRSEIVWQDENVEQYSTKHYRNGSQVDYEGHCWLVIYPSPDGKSLCPLFYWHLADGGVHVSILNHQTIEVLSELYIVAGNPEKMMTVFEHLTDLLENNGHFVETEWARTAFDILDNPVLMEYRFHQSDS